MTDGSCGLGRVAVCTSSTVENVVLVRSIGTGGCGWAVCGTKSRVRSVASMPRELSSDATTK